MGALMDHKQLISAALIAALGAVLLFFGAPQWWFGASFIAGGLALAAASSADRLREWKSWLEEPRNLWRFEFVPLTAIYEVLCIGAIFGLAAAMMPEAALGDRPINHDHAVHFFKAWQLEEHFLTEGKLWGWSHQWFAGYPVNYLYPIGGDLFVIFVHWASFGLLSLSQAYGVAIWLFWGLSGYAVYRFASMGLGRWVGVLAAVFLMTDTASFRYGGWDYALEWGVWPQSLSVAFAVWAMAKIPAVVNGTKWRSVAAFGTLLGLALLTHPLQILHFAIAGPLILAVYWITGGEQPWWRAAYRTVLGYVIGICLGMLWTLPFMSVKDFAAKYGVLWSTTYKIGQDLYELDLLEGTWPFITALGIVGLIGLLASRRFHNLLTGVLVMAFTLAGSVTVVSAFHLLELVDSFRYVQFSRFVILLKPYFFTAAACGAVLSVSALARGLQLAREEGRETLIDGLAARPWAAFSQVAIGVMVLAPLALPFFNEFGSRLVQRDMKEASTRVYKSDRDAVVDWFNQKFPEGEPFFRVALMLSEHDHSFADLGTRIPFPLYKQGYTPANNYKYKMIGVSPEMLDALNIRYAISHRGLPRSRWEQAARFGGIRIYEYKNWKQQPFEIVEGSGDVSVVQFDAEEIVLRAESGSKGRLRLNVSYFPRWKATRDGTPVEIGQTQVAGDGDTAFMTVELEPGTYRFELESGTSEWLGVLLFLIGFLGVILLVLADRDNKVGSRAEAVLGRLDALLERLVERHGRAASNIAATGAAAAVMGLLGLALWTPALESDVAEVSDVAYDFADNLENAYVGVDVRGKGLERCTKALDSFQCGSKEWQRVEREAKVYAEKELRRCIWAHPQSRGPIVMAFDEVPAGDAIVGWLGIAKTGETSNPTPVSLEVAVDGTVIATEKTDADAQIYPFTVKLENPGESIDVQFSVQSKNPGRRHFCFNAQVVELAE